MEYYPQKVFVPNKRQSQIADGTSADALKMHQNVVVRSMIQASPAKQSNSSPFPIKPARLRGRIHSLVVASTPSKATSGDTP